MAHLDCYFSLNVYSTMHLLCPNTLELDIIRIKVWSKIVQAASLELPLALILFHLTLLCQYRQVTILRKILMQGRDKGISN